MDFTPAVTHIGLCAGYGGIELGLQRAIPDLRTVALCEIEAFAISNLVAKMEAGLMDPAPIWPDLKTFPWSAFRDRVDILTGGYPCQPFSAAGQRKGKQDPRHLWPFIADGIRLLKPKCCFFENVEGHISLGLSDVIEDLAGMGYRTTWGIFSASECGAPHQRKRVFILAIPGGIGSESGISGSIQRNEGQSGEFDDCGGERLAHAECGRLYARGNDARKQKRSESEHCSAWTSRPGELANADANGPLDDQQSENGRTTRSTAQCGGQAWPSRPGEPQHGWEPPRVVVGNAASRKNERREPRDVGVETGQGRCGYHAVDSTSKSMGDTRSEEPFRLSGGAGREEVAEIGQSGHRQAKPPLGGDADGLASGLDYAQLCITCDNRTDELRLLGNGVVPATAERAFRVLMRELDNDQISS